MSDPRKPLGGKAYGHIPHLPGSRMGPSDHHCHEGQARICTEKARDRHDVIVVQEKLDGSCVSVARIGDDVHALMRAGFLAHTSPRRQHQLFAAWVRHHRERFLALLDDGERAVGEWMLQAHGTRYALPHEPFVLFDIMRGKKRSPAALVEIRARTMGGFTTPRVLHDGGPLSIYAALAAIATSGHGAIDPVEGAVWRVERQGEVDFLAKYVRPEKVDGAYLFEGGRDGGAEREVWNVDPAEVVR